MMLFHVRENRADAVSQELKAAIILSLPTIIGTGFFLCAVLLSRVIESIDAVIDPWREQTGLERLALPLVVAIFGVCYFAAAAGPLLLPLAGLQAVELTRSDRVRSREAIWAGRSAKRRTDLGRRARSSRRASSQGALCVGGRVVGRRVVEGRRDASSVRLCFGPPMGSPWPSSPVFSDWAHFSGGSDVEDNDYGCGWGYVCTAPCVRWLGVPSGHAAGIGSVGLSVLRRVGTAEFNDRGGGFDGKGHRGLLRGIHDDSPCNL
jgi:hypothetical protein